MVEGSTNVTTWCAMTTEQQGGHPAQQGHAAALPLG
jgi:hypothetical protein